MAKVVSLMGSRPEIIKLSPLIPLLRHTFQHVLVHSSEYTAREMVAVFFEELRLPPPDHGLQAGAGSPARQMAHILIGLEDVLHQERPDALVILGGSNTALVGALVASKIGIRVAHLEAGVRSSNPRLPEEINRVLIDRLSTWLFAPDETARDHLLAEGIPDRRIHVFGSTTVDACQHNLRAAEARRILAQLELAPNQYVVLTLHHDENIQPDVFDEIASAVNALSRIWPIVFPIHPRTLAALGGAHPFSSNVKVIDPLGYLDMLKLARQARALLTDSSGLQEEAVVLGTPAFVVRNETEWPHLVEAGANVLAGNTYRSLMDRAWPLLASDAAMQSLRRHAVTLPGGASLCILRKLHDDLAAGAASDGYPTANIRAESPYPAASLEH